MDTAEALEELSLLQRIIYKSKNQHRRTKYFQDMQMAKRSLLKLKSSYLEVINKVDLALTSLRQPSLTTAKLYEAELGSIKSFLSDVPKLASIAFAGKQRCIFACAKISGLVSQGRFLPFAAVSLGTMAKLHDVAEASFSRLVILFNTLCRQMFLACRRIAFKDMANRGTIVADTVRIVNDAQDQISKDMAESASKIIHQLEEQHKQEEDEDVGEAIDKSMEIAGESSRTPGKSQKRPDISRTKQSANKKLKTLRKLS